MPIKGITDKRSLEGQWSTLGMLHKGSAKIMRKFTDRKTGEVREGATVGQDLAYFRFTSERPEVEQAFGSCYGDKVALVHVYLPYADPDSNFATWMDQYKLDGTLLMRCDGESIRGDRDKAGTWQNYAEGDKLCERGQDCGKCLCKQSGYLQVILPELVELGFVGSVLLITHSWNDIRQLSQSMQAALDMRAGTAQEHLGLRGIPFILSRRTRRIGTPGENGNRIKREKNLCFLEPAPDWVKLQLELRRQAAYQMRALPAPEPGDEAPEGVDIATGEVMDISDDEPSFPTDLGDSAEADWAEVGDDGSRQEPTPKADNGEDDDSGRRCIFGTSEHPNNDMLGKFWPHAARRFRAAVPTLSDAEVRVEAHKALGVESAYDWKGENLGAAFTLIEEHAPHIGE